MVKAGERVTWTEAETNERRAGTLVDEYAGCWLVSLEIPARPRRAGYRTLLVAVPEERMEREAV